MTFEDWRVETGFDLENSNDPDSNEATVVGRAVLAAMLRRGWAFGIIETPFDYQMLTLQPKRRTKVPR